MRNAEEHAKLLAQIAELEKNSVNYFDVEKEFFLIDSNNLAEVKTRLYGYSIQATGIYEQDNLTEEAVAGLDGRGCYVYVENRDGQITIKQDLNGCWGIYLFRHGNYFALSNSFFRLLDHIKFKYPLTVNRDYVYYQVTNDLCSIACSETAVNEVQLLDRSAIIHIEKTRKTLDMEFIAYNEYSISLDSAEGIGNLDNWVKFWGTVFRNVAQHTKFFQADLSGGFDTRISLALLLNSGIDLNELRVFSIKDDLHTHKEDYDIATQIANHYGFKLNRSLPERRFLNTSLSDVFNRNLYVNQTFSNLSRFTIRKVLDKTYVLGGASGETLRYRWQMPPIEFIKTFKGRGKSYSYSLSSKILNAIENILESAIRDVCAKHKITDTNSIAIPQLIYQDTWSRHHFGKDPVCGYFMNIVRLAPALDPKVRALRLDTDECPDYNLLMALLFTRYAPDLLTFPLDLNRSIASETIAYAQKINERFPICRKKVDNLSGGGVFHLQPRDTKAEKILLSGKNNPAIPGGLPQACLKATFESSRTFGLFTSYFDEELYRYAANYYDTHVFGRERYMYAINGVVRVLEDVEISQRNHPPYRDMQRFLEQDFCQIHEDDNANIISNFKRYFTARVDVKLFPKGEGDFQILNVSDDKASVSKPGWLQKGGIGYVIQSYVGTMEIVAKSDIDGQIRLVLLGLDIRHPEDKSKFIPYWIDYTKLVVNGKVILDEITPIWHNKPYRYNLDVKAGEEVKIQVEWLPHRSDT